MRPRPGNGNTRHATEAIRPSPCDPLLFYWHFIGAADVYLWRVVRGLENLHKSVETNPNWGLFHFVVLAGALALAGLLVEAAEVCAVGRRVAPNFSIAKFRGEVVSDSPVYLAQREHFSRGLRLAGAPEG
jgi:hypothetical protein